MQINAIFVAMATLLGRQVAVLAMEYHDNKLWFWNRVDDGATESFLSGSFYVQEAIITDGQDPEFLNDDYRSRNHTLENLYDRWDNYFNFRVGRHGSVDVANWWNTNITAGRCTFGHNAGHLNFVMLGDLQLQVPIPSLNMTFKNIALAQGQAWPHNNWWFGGEDCGRVDGKGDTVICQGTIANGTPITGQFARGNGNNPSTVVFGAIYDNVPHNNG